MPMQGVVGTGRLLEAHSGNATSFPWRHITRAVWTNTTGGDPPPPETYSFTRTLLERTRNCQCSFLQFSSGHFLVTWATAQLLSFLMWLCLQISCLYYQIVGDRVLSFGLCSLCLGSPAKIFTCCQWVPEKAMATHSSVLAWRIPGTGEPAGLPSMGSHRVGNDWSDLAAAAAGPILYCEITQECLGLGLCKII